MLGANPQQDEQSDWQENERIVYKWHRVCPFVAGAIDEYDFTPRKMHVQQIRDLVYPQHFSPKRTHYVYNPLTVGNRELYTIVSG